MAYSAFADKAKPPRETELMATLGHSGTHWRAILETATRDFAPLDTSWVYSGAAWGWALRLRQGKRSLTYLTPGLKRSYAGFALGEKAVLAFLALIRMPLMFATFGFVSGAIGALLYNLIARPVGGIAADLELEAH